MATPGFTAESSLRKAGRQSVRLPSVPAAADEPLGPAQLRELLGAPSVQRVLPDGIEYYGNWCGPLHGGGQPIDAVDRVCCLHDQCYDDRGYLDCSCDRDLIEGMQRAMANPYVSPEGRYKASQAADFFRVSPCLCNRMCLPWIGCFRVPPVPGIPLLKQCIPPYA
jgi:Phospholipase A2